ncbi:MAG: hypothetical protein ACRENL_10820 [Candidatus Dormibacteria bacterium]
MGVGSGLYDRVAPALNGAPPFSFARGRLDGGVSVLHIVLGFTIWVLVIVAVVWLVRELLLLLRARRASAPPPPNPAVAELDMLYARGDVKRADYLTRRADLTGVPPPPGG